MERAHAIRKVAIITVAAVAFVGALTSASRAEDLSGGCAPSLVRYKTSDAAHSTKSANYVNAQGMTTTFSTTGSSSCVIILFSAQAATDAADVMQVQAVVDAVTCEPHDVFFRGGATTYDANAAHFVCVGIGPGAHTARIQFRDLNGNGVLLAKRSMVVQYSK